jgi:hypothetical protein
MSRFEANFIRQVIHKDRICSRAVTRLPGSVETPQRESRGTTVTDRQKALVFQGGTPTLRTQ